MTNSAHPPLPPVKVAFILDGIVQEMLHTDTKLAAIFLSEPLVVDITDRADVNIYSTYNKETDTFTPAVYDENGELIG
jgi:hypothetical protein